MPDSSYSTRSIGIGDSFVLVVQDVTATGDEFTEAYVLSPRAEERLRWDRIWEGRSDVPLDQRALPREEFEAIERDWSERTIGNDLDRWILDQKLATPVSCCLRS